jgi:hypothetical protein
VTGPFVVSEVVTVLCISSNWHDQKHKMLFNWDAAFIKWDFCEPAADAIEKHGSEDQSVAEAQFSTVDYSDYSDFCHHESSLTQDMNRKISLAFWAYNFVDTAAVYRLCLNASLILQATSLGSVTSNFKHCEACCCD